MKHSLPISNAIQVVFCIVLALSFTACDPCKNSVCLNGGTCIEGDCQCPDGYYGEHCESNVCDEVNCQNGGYCDDGSCRCPAGYSGPRCEDYDPCHNVNCLNGGTCSNGDCQCPPGYTGTRCQTKLQPKAFIINKVTITGIPETNSSGFCWDNDGTCYPDIYLNLTSESQNIILRQTNYYANCRDNNTYPYNMNDYSMIYEHSYILQFRDYDSASSSDVMLNCRIIVANLHSSGTSTYTCGGFSFRISGEWVY